MWRKMRNWLIKKTWQYFRIDLNWMKKYQAKPPMSPLRYYAVDESTVWSAKQAEAIFRWVQNERTSDRSVDN